MNLGRWFADAPSGSYLFQAVRREAQARIVAEFLNERALPKKVKSLRRTDADRSVGK
jgi:hypothetical protein